MSRTAARTDGNHTEIVEALRKAGAFVQSMAAMGKGVPDVLVGYKGLWNVLEIKDGRKVTSKRKLTMDEVKWLMDVRNRAPVHVVESVEQALEVIKERA